MGYISGNTGENIGPYAQISATQGAPATPSTGFARIVAAGTQARPRWITNTGTVETINTSSRSYVPYKFRVWMSAAANSIAGTFVRIPYDTVVFDTSGNVDMTTNKGRFTAPVAGYYQFHGSAAFTGTTNLNRAITAIYINGGAYARGTDVTFTTGSPHQSTVSDLVYMNAGDYAEIYCWTNVNANVVNSAYQMYFSGYLVSTD